MTDEQFRIVCNIYEFAPSRALRELLEVAITQAVISERKAILQMSADNWFKTQAEYDAAIRARGQA
jgi:hypothetical protein